MNAILQSLENRMTALAVGFTERGLVPESFLRGGIRRLLAQRLRDEAARSGSFAKEWLGQMAAAPIALVPDLANAQHYEVPSDFFRQVLGRQLKYSGCLWSAGITSLDDAEEAMLSLTAQRAGLADGQRILELGCGWGSLTLWMARHFPGASITAVSNSAGQRAFIEATARAQGVTNIQVVTADMNGFEPAVPGFDRVVSVEMFEHMRNWQLLLRRIQGWLLPDGALFLHVFAHRRFAYPFEIDGPGNWMGREFFSGGMMPSLDLLEAVLQESGSGLKLVERHEVGGEHYALTAEAWHANLLEHRGPIEAIFRRDLSAAEARGRFERWRVFFLACAELFGYAGGNEWLVLHARLGRVDAPGRA
jgi:cyclopropane-fatty-acyl-phospholipid synthase